MKGEPRATRRRSADPTPVAVAPEFDDLPVNGVVQPAGLMNKASKALFWSFANTAVSRLGTLGIGIVLARLLGPKEFGTYAVGLVALTAVLSFNELGVSLAIVRWPGDPKLIAPTVNTISVVSSAIITVAGFLYAPSFAAAMGDPGATSVVRLLGVTVLASGAVATPVALMQREFNQGKKMAIDQVNSWLGTGVSIVLAVAGMGAMSLAIGRLVGSTVSGVMFVRAAPGSYRFGLNKDEVKPLLRFGLPLAGASVIVFAVGFVDQLIVGRVLGSVILGVYVLATNLSNWPVQMFSQPLRSVAPAAFARIQHDPDGMRSTLRVVIGLLTAVSLPICLLIAGTAKPLIAVVYGPEWAKAAAPLAWLAMLAGLRIFYELAYDFFVVRGASRAVLFLQTIWLIALVPALIIGAHASGVAGVGAGHVIVAGGLILPLYLWQFHRLGISPFDIVLRILPALAAAAVVGLVAVFLGQQLGSDFLVCAISGVLAVLVIAALVYRDRVQIKGLRGGPPAPAPVPVGVE